MGAIVKQSVTRTVTVSDLTPAEMASIFAAYTCDEQAAFFDAMAEEVKDWPGTGWCMQCAYFVPKLGPGGRAIIEKMAEWFND